MINVLLLYNPKSGSATFSENLEYVVMRFQKEGQQIIPYRMDNIDDFKRYMEAMDFKWIHKILIAGGDGTIHQVVNEMIRHDVDVPIALFPTGTANDFSQFFGVPKSLDGMIEHALKNTFTTCDLGKANDQFFINVASFGNLVDISQRVNDQAKNVLGVLAYYLKGIEEFPRLKSFDIQIKTEDRNEEMRVFFALIMNGKSAGGFRKLAPYSEINDGLLDVVVFKKCPVLEIMPLLLQVVSGEHPNSEHIEYFQTEAIEIKTEGTIGTDLDGEIGPNLPLKIQVVKSRLKVIQ